MLPSQPGNDKRLAEMILKGGRKVAKKKAAKKKAAKKATKKTKKAAK